ncbi:MAG: xanthine dehydrogenase molybdopterin binding subunit [Bacteroidota bacterium]
MSGIPHTIRFVLDDRIIELDFLGSNGLKPTTTVLNYLRSLPGHKGTKEGCAEGDCGACTVVLAEPSTDGRLDYHTVDSCLVFLPMIHGKQLITVENLALRRQNRVVLHPVQRLMVESNGSQCGFCTPGMVMSLFGLFKNHDNPSREIIEDALTGNLCRCTGYQSILDAAEQTATETRSDQFSANEALIAGMLESIRESQHTIELRTPHQTWLKPFTLDEALRLRSEHPLATVINGSTDVALRQTKHHELLSLVIDLSGVDELKYCREKGTHFVIGAGQTMEQIKSFASEKLPALHKILSVFGSLQIRHVATLGGNIGSASPIGDTLPLLIAFRAEIVLQSMHSERVIGISDFITGYRKTRLEPGELITAVRIPKPGDDTRIESYKISKRTGLDISTVSAAFSLTLRDGMVAESVLVYGGMAEMPKRALHTEAFLAGREWNFQVVNQAMAILEDEFTPISDARAGATYRKIAGSRLLLKFFTNTSPLHDRVTRRAGKTGSLSAVDDTCAKHVTGESVFIGDIEGNGQLLTGRVVYSKQAHAVLKNIDISKALQVKGVKTILTARDIPGENQMGAVVSDEPCLAEKEVFFIGQAIALIAAENEEAAVEAERLITIDYEPLPAILDIESAMAASNSLAPQRKIVRGNPDEVLAMAPHLFTGELKTGAQEHWYLETQSAMAVPGEGKEMMMHSSTQNPAETQAIVAEVLGISKNEVEVEVKRIGGAFGGKETQGNHVAAWSALLANATRQPVRIQLCRDDDQIMTGKRHRFLSRYSVGFDDEGRILAYKVELNSDAGSSTDLSKAILERAMLHADNAYFLPHVQITGRAWKTNLPSNTAFRGFGGPQGMAVIENAIDRIARYLKKDTAAIRRLNFYRLDVYNPTPYGQEVENNHLERMFNDLMTSSGYEQRRKAIDKFNAENHLYKKGMALTPVKFGISFTTSFLNQAGALVNIYTDGTVLVNHGGTEMGQGLHTKIVQIASSELGISPGTVKVNATNTSKVPNTSPTAASTGSDLNGMAVKNAIDILKARLSRVAAGELTDQCPGKIFLPENMAFDNNQVFDRHEPNEKIAFSRLCDLARMRQVSLSSTGYYKTPGIFFDREAGQGNPFHYFAFGMAVSEVITDTLTGAHTLLRTDILHDVGDSIHEAIDRGQIEGGFIQGMGWCTTEEIKWDRNGNLLTHSPDTYKIPAILDIPLDFRVDLLKDAPNPGTIRRSKAVGEPPFMLGLSVWLAIKDSISAIANHEREPEFSLPATGEVILLSAEKIK